ncbi:MAG TPA: MarR family winged helix-turn-helix transcriptional regulator [Candidatus Saccharimonadia bacterium]|jgi:DNA-binding MarR family transcriptional regulator|nr:MarR family winged helix-turn-helix transcriptional regulator [Candidatus Saccharimonadia bacterium]
MTKPEAQANTAMLLLWVYMPVKQEMLKLAEKYDLTLMQANALCVLDPDHAVPTNALSNNLSCDPSNITGIVERLVAAGYLERGDHPTDRRVKTISLTDKGRTLRAEFFRQTAQIVVPGLSALPAAEQRTFVKLLAKIRAGQ